MKAIDYVIKNNLVVRAAKTLGISAYYFDDFVQEMYMSIMNIEDRLSKLDEVSMTKYVYKMCQITWISPRSKFSYMYKKYQPFNEIENFIKNEDTTELQLKSNIKRTTQLLYGGNEGEL